MIENGSRYSQLSFSKASELVRDGAPTPGCRRIIHRVSSEALADRIDGPVSTRSRQAFLGARAASLRITLTRERSRCSRSPSQISKRMRSCNWSCRLGLLTKDAVLAQKRAWRDRAQTGPSMRSASASEEKRWIMGQHRGMRALSLTSSDALLKKSCEYRKGPLHLRSAHDERSR